MRPLSRSSRFVPVLASAVAGLLLAGAATVPSYAGSDEPPIAVDPGTPEQVAEESLAAAEGLVHGDSTADPTLVLNQLGQTLEDLPAGSDRQQARAILARPTTDDNRNDGLFEYRTDEEVPLCGTHVCVHYVDSTSDAPEGGDGDPATVPAWVTQTADVMDTVWASEIDSLRYRSPLPDRGPARSEGPSPLLDVYIGDIGGNGLYGYAAADRPGRDVSSAYLVLDDDYRPGQFGTATPPVGLLRVTAAHEFFHAVQFGYDYREDAWFQEATATWMEERVYDSVNDNRQFLPASAMALPGRSLDSPVGGTWYGNWIFFEFLSQRMGTGVVRSMWSRAARDGVYSTLAISRTLKAEGTSLRTRFAGFAAGNLSPARTYSEGKAYRRPAVAKTYTLTSTTKSTGGRTIRLDHLTSRSYAFQAGSSLTGAWRVRLGVNGPSGISGAVATVSRTNGTLTRHTVSLELRGQRRDHPAAVAVRREPGDPHPGEHVRALPLQRRKLLLQRRPPRPERAVRLLGVRDPLTGLSLLARRCHRGLHGLPPCDRAGSVSERP